jgi:hypothetical protein
MGWEFIKNSLKLHHTREKERDLMTLLVVYDEIVLLPFLHFQVQSRAIS